MAFADMDIPPEESASSSTTLMPRSLSMLLGVAAVFIAAQGIQPFRSIFAATFMALNIIIVVWPIQHYLAKRIPRALASIVAGIAALTFLVVLIYTIGWTLARLIAELPKYTAQFNNMTNAIIDFATRYNIDTNLVVQEALTQLRNLDVSTIVSTLGGIASGLTNFVTLLVMIVVILVFMVVDSVRFSDRMRRLGEKHSPTLAWALASFARGTRKYWVVTTVIGLILATCNGGLLLALGVPLALVWAAFSFVTNYIPYVGFFLGLLPPVIMALLANDPLTALWVIVGYCAINVLLVVLIQPKFAGDAVGITPTVAVLSVLLWAFVLGPLGAILAIPATLLIKTLFVDIDPRTRWLNALIASNPTTSDQDPMRLSNLLARSKRISKLTAKTQKPGVTKEKAEAAHRELAALTSEEPSETSGDDEL
ncbi:MAG: AI-2E family transporter [Propionibacteriaceae bacterium]|nr:AI-2E family transporter [Propionibacteriaceae bacterium]